MRQKIVYSLLLTAILFSSCGKKAKKSYDEIGNAGLTVRTENLQANLRSFAKQGVIIGQQYATLEGVGWVSDTIERSDIHGVCGDFPASSGYELLGLEHGWSMNSDSLDFSVIREDALRLFKRGGLILMKWTAPDPRGNEKTLDDWVGRIARYLASLQNDYGIKAPVVLFLYPQEGKSWYDNLSDEAYKDMFEHTIDKLKDLDVTNALYGYSCNSAALKKGIEDRLPEGVDVINMTLFGDRDTRESKSLSSSLPESLNLLKQTASEHHLAQGLTTGMEGLPDSTFFSKTLLPAIQQSGLSYILFGRNHGDFSEGYCYTPYPGCGNARINDFMKFYNNRTTIFLKELNGLYLNGK
ncbi:hypothetical protein [Prevotella sp. KH2C16]|uniref:hypothetical protein n=1 Tax=Prevotella sp. KH2C16 TaxID=1855325 RepID=UPI0008F3D2ED|nr:hypothetical protein [Prevotella sp. KH2C16]SFG33394.1 hypothetical protein SAMN05216383_11062 [Prevotella sp. KH2C16]